MRSSVTARHRWCAALLVATTACTSTGGSRGLTFAEARDRAVRDATTQIARAEEAFTACMVAEGFDGQDARPPDRTPSSPLDSGGETDPEVDGYGFAPVALAFLAGEDAADLPESTSGTESSVERRALEEARRSCERSSGLLDVPPSIAALARRAARARARLVADPAYQQALDDWSRCMAEAGFPGAPSPEHLSAAAEVALRSLPVTTSDAAVEIAGAGGNVRTDDPIVLTLAVDVYGDARTLDDLAVVERTVAVQDRACQEQTGLEERIAGLFDSVFAELPEE